MTINQFKDEYRFLSNFYYSRIIIDKILYPTVEHFYQSQKTSNGNERERIKNSISPGDAKRAGKFIQLRPDWEQVKTEIMLKAVRAKFQQNEKLRNLLLDTYPQMLIEGNYWHDNIWGQCFCKKCKDIKGQNLLGNILMKVRQEFKC